MNICELIFGSERAFVLFLDRFFFPADPLSLLLLIDAGGGVEFADDFPLELLPCCPPVLDLFGVSAIGLQCTLLLGEIMPLPE